MSGASSARCCFLGSASSKGRASGHKHSLVLQLPGICGASCKRCTRMQHLCFVHIVSSVLDMHKLLALSPEPSDEASIRCTPRQGSPLLCVHSCVTAGQGHKDWRAHQNGLACTSAMTTAAVHAVSSLLTKRCKRGKLRNKVDRLMPGLSAAPFLPGTHRLAIELSPSYFGWCFVSMALLLSP